MKILFRILLLAPLALSFIAGWHSYRYLQGDRISYTLGRAESSTTIVQARAMEARMREGLAINPMAWGPRVRYAGYMARQGEADPAKYEDALEALAEVSRYHTSTQAIALEASINSLLGHDAEAIRLFEKVHRISVLDRSVVQHLIGLYNEAKDYEKLQKIAIESDIRWWNVFDYQVALAHVALDRNDIPLTAKYFLLGSEVPRTRFAFPKPAAYELPVVEQRVKDASLFLIGRNYKSPWATLD